MSNKFLKKAAVTNTSEVIKHDEVPVGNKYNRPIKENCSGSDFLSPFYQRYLESIFLSHKSRPGLEFEREAKVIFHRKLVIFPSDFFFLVFISIQNALSSTLTLFLVSFPTYSFKEKWS